MLLKASASLGMLLGMRGAAMLGMLPPAIAGGIIVVAPMAASFANSAVCTAPSFMSSFTKPVCTAAKFTWTRAS
jgi:hypothetical protein